jgi:hypothetical protein
VLVLQLLGCVAAAVKQQLAASGLHCLAVQRLMLGLL